MLIPIPKDVIEAQARDRLVDAWLGSLGVSAAVVSAGFAAYMAVSGPASGPASRPMPLLAMGTATSHAPRFEAQSTPNAVAEQPGDTIDFDPTGTIPAAPVSSDDAKLLSSRTVLPDFAVRDAFDGTALVEAQGTLRMVQPGATIEGAGRVLSIARGRKGWVVETSGGLIVQRR
ncbi:hypothetical protein P7D22_04020 [Lichenihabitans sp. Uapishka_5]|uniref:hypothetical protein n=1 Tax=Lichenihabitans sp. Uapishka_5 TaxID=3037302 RepID=UPI0029E7D91F|nr:hypothetical protein [Lichenihabitans sp. Uapishka_5]MDX7950343.1 hypothetical protein [Lichenihabitans sp. Uapishka_5]